MLHMSPLYFTLKENNLNERRLTYVSQGSKLLKLYTSFYHVFIPNFTPRPKYSFKLEIPSLQENTPNSDGGSDGLQCRRTFVTDFRPISNENQKIEVVGIPSAISDGIPTKHGSSEFSDDFSMTFR